MRLDDLQDPQPRKPAANRPDELPVVNSEQLFGARNEIGINHNGLTYRLRITRQGKLVLNK